MFSFKTEKPLLITFLIGIRSLHCDLSPTAWGGPDIHDTLARFENLEFLVDFQKLVSTAAPEKYDLVINLISSRGAPPRHHNDINGKLLSLHLLS